MRTLRDHWLYYMGLFRVSEVLEFVLIRKK